MQSESARVTTAAEARFRVQAPNSKPRAIKVIALDARGEDVARRLAAGGWAHSTFLTAGTNGSTLRDLAGQPRRLQDEVETADLVVMLASPGGRAEAATPIGEACSRRRVMTTTLVLGTASASEEALSMTLAQVRPWSLMLVIANDDRYVDDMLTALRA